MALLCWIASLSVLSLALVGRVSCTRVQNASGRLFIPFSDVALRIDLQGLPLDLLALRLGLCLQFLDSGGRRRKLQSLLVRVVLLLPDYLPGSSQFFEKDGKALPQSAGSSVQSADPTLQALPHFARLP